MDAVARSIQFDAERNARDDKRRSETRMRVVCAEHRFRRHDVTHIAQEAQAIALERVTLLCVVDHIDAANRAHWVAPVYLARAFAGEPRIVEPDEHDAFGWFALSDLPPPLTHERRVAVAQLVTAA